MKPEVVFTRSAPKTGFSEGTESPIAQGVKGQGPLDPATKTIVSQDIAEQTRVTLDNVKAVLEAGGTSIANVVRVGVYLRNMDDFAVFNRVFKEYFQVSLRETFRSWTMMETLVGSLGLVFVLLLNAAL